MTINTGSPTPVSYAVRSGHAVTASTPPGSGAGTATFSVSKAPQVGVLGCVRALGLFVLTK